jgi:hypothetical protein
MYPMVVATSSDGSYTVGNIFYKVSEGGYSYSACSSYSPSTCNFVLLCPEQSFKLVRSDAVITDVTSLSSIPKYQIAVSGPNMTSANYSIPANGFAAISITLAPGDLYDSVITWGRSNAGAKFYTGGCDGSYPYIASGSMTSSLSEAVTFDKTGILILSAEDVDQTVTISFTSLGGRVPFETCIPPASVNTNYEVPAACQNKISSLVLHPSYPPSVFFAKTNDTFLKQFPGASAACYNAFITETGNSYFRPCLSANSIDTGYACPATCVDRCWMHRQRCARSVQPSGYDVRPR